MQKSTVSRPKEVIPMMQVSALNILDELAKTARTRPEQLKEKKEV